MLPGEVRRVRCDNYYKVSSTSAEQVRSKHTGMPIHTTHAADISKKRSPAGKNGSSSSNPDW